MTLWHLDVRLQIRLQQQEKERWIAVSREEGLDLAQWIRRALRRAPASVPLSEPGGVLDAMLNLRINAEEKRQCAQRARALGISLSAYVRAVVNAAAQP